MATGVLNNVVVIAVVVVVLVAVEVADAKKKARSELHPLLWLDYPNFSSQT